MKATRTITVRFTELEAKQVEAALNNCWGNGDWEDYLNNAQNTAAFKRGWNKLQKAIREGRKAQA